MNDHIDSSVKASGKEEFSKDQYDALREYIRSIQSSPYDFSDTIMNIQGTVPELEPDRDGPNLGPLTVSEYINQQAPIEQLESAEVSLEDAFTSWQAGALEALKS